MNHRKSLLVLSFVLGIVSTTVLAQRATEKSIKKIETVVGKWQLQKVYAGSREITTNPNAETQSWIEFNSDGTYTRNTEISDQGSYRLNENHSILYLESNDKTETSSATSVHNLNEFDISIRDGMLTMQSRREGDSGTKYVYAKSGGEEH